MKISIIGAAGYVGSNVALTLALRGLADEFVLVDPYKQNIVEQLAMDTNTAAAEQGVSVRAGDYPDARDSNIVIVAAGASQGVIASRMEMLPKNLPIIRDIAEKIKQCCDDTIVITTTNPVDPLNYAMYRFTGFDRSKIIGYSENDSIRFRAMVAKALGQEMADVKGMVIGEHGDSQVLLFSTVKVKGKSVNLDNAFKEKIRSQVPEILRRFEELNSGRTAGVTSSVGIKGIVEAIVRNSHGVIPCSAILEGEYGVHNLSMGVPVALGSGGINDIVELELADDERPYLTATVDALRPAMHQVDNFLDVPLTE